MPKTLSLASLLLCGALFTSPALADEIDCNDAWAAPRSTAICACQRASGTQLDGTRIDGNIKVGRGATLQARGVRVEGNIQAEEREVAVANSRIGGNVQLEQGSAVRVDAVEVDGEHPGVREPRRDPGQPQPGRRQPAVQGEPQPAERR